LWSRPIILVVDYPARNTDRLSLLMINTIVAWVVCVAMD
jgi:hypothetical protein